MPNRRNLLASALGLLLPVCNDLERRDAELHRVVRTYWRDTESTFNAWRVRVESRRLRAAIERAGMPEGFRIRHAIAAITMGCKTGRRGDKDFWLRVRAM